MSDQSTAWADRSTVSWEMLEAWTRGKIQAFLQALLEEEVTAFLGGRKSERGATVDARPGYRNGYGKLRRLSLTAGTMTLRRPRVRDLDARFQSALLPRFQRRTREVGELLPQLSTSTASPRGASSWPGGACSARVPRCRRVRYSGCGGGGRPSTRPGGAGT